MKERRQRTKHKDTRRGDREGVKCDENVWERNLKTSSEVSFGKKSLGRVIARRRKIAGNGPERSQEKKSQ
jgi:hypothetical protein